MAIRFDLVLRDRGREKTIRWSRWPRARTVNEIPSSRGAQRALCSPVGVVGDHSVAYTRRASAGGRRPRFLDGATLARVPPSGAAACLLAAEWQAHTQHRAEPWRRLLVALGLHPVVVRGTSPQLPILPGNAAPGSPPSQQPPSRPPARSSAHVPIRLRERSVSVTESEGLVEDERIRGIKVFSHTILLIFNLFNSFNIPPCNGRLS